MKMSYDDMKMSYVLDSRYECVEGGLKIEREGDEPIVYVTMYPSDPCCPEDVRVQKVSSREMFRFCTMYLASLGYIIKRD